MKKKTKKSARPASVRELERLERKLGLSRLAEKLGRSRVAVARALDQRRASRALSKDALRLAEKTRAAEKRRTRLPKRLSEGVRKHGVTRVAKRLERSPATVRRWIREGGAPPIAKDAVRQVLLGERPYPLDYKRGEARRPSEAQEKRVREAMAGVLRAKPTEKDVRAWERAKGVRDKLTRAAWRELVTKIGKERGLRPTGRYSIERFIHSPRRRKR